MGAGADAELPLFAALGEGSGHGGVFIMDVVRVVLAGVSGTVSAECADAVRRRSDAVRRRRAWVRRFSWIRRSRVGYRGSGVIASVLHR